MGTIAAIVLWYLVGLGSFILWWTKEFDLETGDIPMMLFVSLLGPIGFLIGWMIHGDSLFGEKVLIKRRRK